MVPSTTQPAQSPRPPHRHRPILNMAAPLYGSNQRLPEALSAPAGRHCWVSGVNAALY
jgi:hypothetical protein